jgi:hypothetical protein
MSPEVLYTVLQQGQAVSLVRARDAETAIEIAMQMLGALGPVYGPLHVRTATPVESTRFFNEAIEWSGGMTLAGITLENGVEHLH